MSYNANEHRYPTPGNSPVNQTRVVPVVRSSCTRSASDGTIIVQSSVVDEEEEAEEEVGEEVEVEVEEDEEIKTS